LGYASQLLLIAGVLIRKVRAQIALVEITPSTVRWARHQRRRGRAERINSPVAAPP
jgi:hypothetical protein